jgi:hypothetical protein
MKNKVPESKNKTVRTDWRVIGINKLIISCWQEEWGLESQCPLLQPAF